MTPAASTKARLAAKVTRTTRARRPAAGSTLAEPSPRCGDETPRENRRATRPRADFRARLASARVACGSSSAPRSSSARARFLLGRRSVGVVECGQSWRCSGRLLGPRRRAPCAKACACARWSADIESRRRDAEQARGLLAWHLLEDALADGLRIAWVDPCEHPLHARARGVTVAVLAEDLVRRGHRVRPVNLAGDVLVAPEHQPAAGAQLVERHVQAHRSQPGPEADALPHVNRPIRAMTRA